MSDKYKLGEGSLKQKDLPIVLRINRLEPGGEQSSRAKQVPTEIPLNKSASKSEDSLDSGIYSRQKSCDSMDSLDSTESSGFNGDNSTGYHQVALTPTDEAIPPLPIQQYEDYWREYQDIRQSAVILSEETKQTVSRTDSGDDQDDDGEADWLRLAGLSDLVVTGSTGMMASNQTPSSSSNRPSMDNLSSMTVLSTLTRPQREAVLRRITSFNRAQKTKRRPKPAITAVFPTIETETKEEPDGPHSTADKPADARKNDDPNLKAASLPRGVTGFSDSGFYAGRRYSETPKTRKTSGSNSPVSPTSPTKDYRSRHQKNVESIVATESTKVSSPEPTPRTNVDITTLLPVTRIPLLVANTLATSCVSTSMPDLNQETQHNSPTVSITQAISSSHINDSSESLPIISDFPTNQTPRAQHSMSDIPSRVIIPPDSPARLSLTVSKPPTSPNLTVPVISVTNPRMRSTVPLTRAPRSLRYSAPITVESQLSHETSPTDTSTSPKSRFFLPQGFNFSLRRRHPSTSPSKGGSQSKGSLRESKRSPLRKISLSSFKGSPVRTGSYQFGSSPSSISSYRPSLRRARSLKATDERSVSLVSVKPSGNGSELNYITPASIETLSISTRSADSKSWGGSREDIPQFNDDKQDKNMSYSETADKQNLPNFSLVREPLGITKISDLSPTDMRKVQSLALIELTALFDLRGIELKRRKAKAKIKDAGVFGSPLTTLIEWDRKRTNLPTIKIPQVLREIIIFLEAKALKDEGILRKSGSAARIKLLKQDIENRFGPNPDTSAIAESSLWRDAHPHDVAALLKLFLRELPDPLLTTEYIDAFHSCEMISERKEQLQALNLLIILLHEMHRDSLQFLLSFLGLVVANEPYNKMGLNNVAMITAPNLFMARKQSKREASTTAASQDLKRAAGTSNIVRMLIKYHRLLWTVPAFMLTQVRHMHRAETSAKKHTTQSKDKYKVKFFQGKTKDGNKKSSSAKQPLEYEAVKGVIRVQAPDMLISSMAVQLDNTITASDIIARFQRQSERIRQTGSQTKPVVINNTTHALFEVGGNIHQRCLDPDTNMSALMRVNPDASWFIKPRTGT
nr:rho GTPase-activating protein 12 isoform X1 [Ciona intestinalis]|eukprot:XP_018673262.1 rho GTPase-activating protein 12 isoform X1 [Ciona intestinalis]